jgi:hypothetical protein
VIQKRKNLPAKEQINKIKIKISESKPLPRKKREKKNSNQDLANKKTLDDKFNLRSISQKEVE